MYNEKESDESTSNQQNEMSNSEQPGGAILYRRNSRHLGASLRERRARRLIDNRSEAILLFSLSLYDSFWGFC